MGPDDERLIASRLTPKDRVVVHSTDLNVNENLDQYTSSDESGLPQDPEDTHWTTVKCQRVCSFGSLEQVRKIHLGNIRTKMLTLDQVQTVRMAANALTRDQNAVLHERQKELTHRRKNSSSRGESTSKLKGANLKSGVASALVGKA